MGRFAGLLADLLAAARLVAEILAWRRESGGGAAQEGADAPPDPRGEDAQEPGDR